MQCRMFCAKAYELQIIYKHEVFRKVNTNIVLTFISNIVIIIIVVVVVIVVLLLLLLLLLLIMIMFF